jgi:hypothetical protein
LSRHFIAERYNLALAQDAFERGYGPGELSLKAEDYRIGFSISWLAVRNNNNDDTSVLASLGLEKTGETEESPGKHWCSTRVGEWTVVWSNSYEPARFRGAPSKLRGEVLVCDVEEHVMYASTSAFNDGILSWRIVHDAQQAQDDLTITGTPPESHARIRAEQFARVSEDPEVDRIFEIPIRMAKEVVGFRYDEKYSSAFDILRVTKPRWKFW